MRSCLKFSQAREARLQLCGKEPRLCGPAAFSPVTRTKNSQGLGVQQLMPPNLGLAASRSFLFCPLRSWLNCRVLCKFPICLCLAASKAMVPQICWTKWSKLTVTAVWRLLGQAQSCLPEEEEQLPAADCIAVLNACMWSGMSRLQDNKSKANTVPLSHQCWNCLSWFLKTLWALVKLDWNPLGYHPRFV